MKRFAIILVFLISLIGCKGDPGPAGPLLTGSISGKTVLVDDSGNWQSNSSGITVSLEGTLYSAVSDSSGFWQLNNIPTGIYIISMYKAGFFKEGFPNFQFAGGGKFFWGENSIGKIPPITVSNLTATVLDSINTINFAGTISPADSLSLQVVILLSKEKPSDSSKFSYQIYLFSSYIPARSTTFTASIQLSANDYLLYNVPKGTKLYATSFPVPIGGWNVIVSPMAIEYVFDSPGVVLSNAVSIALP
jgi:hypothetical protein